MLGLSKVTELTMLSVTEVIRTRVRQSNLGLQIECPDTPTVRANSPSYSCCQGSDVVRLVLPEEPAHSVNRKNKEQ